MTGGADVEGGGRPGAARARLGVSVLSDPG